MDEALARMVETGNACNILVGNREGKKALTIPRHRCKYNIKTDQTEIGCESIDWFHVAQVYWGSRISRRHIFTF